MLEMLRSLPPELPLETRRATVHAMLATLGKNMGATPQSLVADASRKLAALQSFNAFMERKSSAAVEAAQAEIAQLETQIEARQSAMRAARAELNRVTQNCEAQADKLNEVLEFFSLDSSPNAR